MPWLDAAWHPAGLVDAPLPFDSADRGLQLADGVFDTALVLGGRMVWRDAHLERLMRHARQLGFVVDPERLDAAVDGVLAPLAGGHGTLRLTATRGPGPRGLAPPAAPRPTILATVAALVPALLFAPMRLHATAIRRNETSPLARVKSLGYGDAVLAAQQARAAGCDDALFRNGAGAVACAGAGNLFAQFGDRLVTPPLAAGVLDGVTRAVLLGGARAAGLVPVEAELHLADLHAADALFCTNSLRLVAPVIAVDGRDRVSDAQAPADLVAAAVLADAGIDPLRLGAPPRQRS